MQNEYQTHLPDGNDVTGTTGAVAGVSTLTQWQIGTGFRT